jgi:O-antigen/teichoic acid export membrane protein
MKTKKEILNNLLSLGSIDVLGLLIPLITLPILTRALGAELYGQYFLFLTMINLGRTAIDYGVQYSGVRDINKHIKRNKRIVFFYENYQGLRFLIFCAYCVLLVAYAFLFLDEKYIFLVCISGIAYLFGYFLMSSWFFIAVGETKWLLISSLLTKLTLLFIIVFFIHDTNGFNLLIYFTGFSTLILSFFLFFKIKKRYKCHVFSISISFRLLNKGKDIFIGLLAPNLYNSVPIIILGSISDPLHFSKFAIATRVCGIINSFQGVIAKSIFPVLARRKGVYVHKIMLINILFALPAFLIIIFYGELLLSFFLGEEIGADNKFLNILVIGVIFIAISNSISQGFFVPNGYDRIYRNISIRVSLIAFFINIILIYYYGLLGGAIGLTIARCLFAVDYWVSFKLLERKVGLIS